MLNLVDWITCSSVWCSPYGRGSSVWWNPVAVGTSVQIAAIVGPVTISLQSKKKETYTLWTQLINWIQKLSSLCKWESFYLINIFTGSITTIPQKSWFQCICSKFFGLWHGHNYFWPPWLWRLLDAKNVGTCTHLGTQLNVPFIPQCHFSLQKEIKTNPNFHQ